MAEHLSLNRLNDASCEQFVTMLTGLYPSAMWVAEHAWIQRPFATLAALKHALMSSVRDASPAQQLGLVQGYPNLVLENLSAIDGESVKAQMKIYRDKFGFPFILALSGPRSSGLSAQQIIATLERRLAHPRDYEFDEAIRNIHRIADIKLAEIVGVEPTLGNMVWDWAEDLAQDSDPEFAAQGQLTVTYLTPAHRAVAAKLCRWMKDDCGFDEVSIDAVGNVVGVYHGQQASAKRLLTGSHYDTVRNAGKYDGRLGILTPMACVQALAKEGRRLPFGIEVVGFAEEEGQRYKAAFLGSSALTGHFDFKWLDQRDSAGVSMREAMATAGLNPEQISSIKRDPSRYLGFVEVHIEQGPVLNQLNLPLGVVTSINGSVRYVGEIRGMASHAGTTPMDRRRDAAAAAAEFLLFVEKRATEAPELVATVGMLSVPNGSINVVPGCCQFSLDVRSTTDGVRDACVDDILSALSAICTRRGVSFTLEETMRVPASPSAPEWQARWENAVAQLGLPVFRMPSGAGHDAMKLHDIMPQAMLFVRGENAGISHNPLESTTSEDMDLCVHAFQILLDHLSSET